MLARLTSPTLFLCFHQCVIPSSAFSIDIEAAHKTVRVREQDGGLLGLRTELPGQPARYYSYKVCPFGAVFSALWFARVGAFLVRVLHMLIWIRHMLGMYVDDLIGSTDKQAVHMVATVTLPFCDVSPCLFAMCLASLFPGAKFRLGIVLIGLAGPFTFEQGRCRCLRASARSFAWHTASLV